MIRTIALLFVVIAGALAQDGGVALWSNVMIATGPAYKLTSDSFTSDGKEIPLSPEARQALNALVNILRKRPLCGDSYDPANVVPLEKFTITWQDLKAK